MAKIGFFLHNFLKHNRKLKYVCSLCSGTEVVKHVPQKEHQLRLYSAYLNGSGKWREDGEERRRNIGDQPPLLAWPHLLCKTHGDS